MKSRAGVLAGQHRPGRASLVALLLGLTLALLLVLLVGHAGAQERAVTSGSSAGSTVRSASREPVQAPQLRIETGMHTTLIRNMVVDAPRNRLITGGDDKTVRIWQMPEARLLTTLRVPLDAHHEGQIFAVAVSPDGATVAASGWTGFDWDGSNAIYLFDVASGQLQRRIGGLPNTVNALAWTRDGRHLVAGLHMAFRGGVGFLAVEVASGKIVASDNQYNNLVMDLDVLADGRVAVVAYDGLVRLYDRDFRLIGRRPAAVSGRPITVRASPDGNWLAIGFVDQPVVALQSARDLAPLYNLPVPEPRGQRSFLTVAWSADGRTIYAGGEDDGSGANPVWRWNANGRVAPQRIPLGRNRISRIEAMSGNRMAFASEDPGVGVIEADGRVLSYRGPDIVNFSDARNAVLLAGDGSLVSYPVVRDGSTRRVFAVLGPGDQALDAAPPAVPLHAPLQSAPGLVVRDWQDSFAPLVNGLKVTLDPYEYTRSYALRHDGGAVLFGTEWALRLVDREARELWQVRLPAVAWAVNISADHRFALAALSDGTLRWYRLTDGAPVLAYFPHANGRDWIAWTPEGYYNASIYGDNYIGWHINRGKTLTPDFYRAVQFDRVLFRPDVVAAVFRQAMGVSAPATTPVPLAADFRIERLPEIAPARLVVRVEAVEQEGGRARARLRISGEKNRLALRDWSVFVNNIPVTPGNQRRLAGAEADAFERVVEVDLPARASTIRVESFNGTSMGLAETFVGLDRPVTPRRGGGDLYLLAVGVNAFPDLPEGMHLAYAARDADQLAKTLTGRGAGFYRAVKTRVLSDSSGVLPTRAAISAALQFLQEARAEDTVVVFLASHGVSDPAGNYYFVPRDVTRADVTGAQKGQPAASVIAWEELSEALRGAAGRRMLIVDTCHAGRIEGRLESHALLKRSAASLFPMVMAAKGDEQSQEYEPGNHGLFTYAMLEALRPDTDTDRDGLLSIQELFAAARPLVDRLREKSIGPQSPQIVAPDPLGAIALVPAATVQ